MLPRKNYPAIAIGLSLAAVASTISFSFPASSFSVEKLAKTEQFLPQKLTQESAFSPVYVRRCFPVLPGRVICIP